MQSDLLSRLGLLSVVALLMAQAKGIHVIPTDDDPPPPPPAATVAERAYHEGVAAHDKALAMISEAPSMASRENKRNLRKIERQHDIALRRFDESLVYATEASPPPAYLPDIYQRTAAMRLFGNDKAGARAALTRALALRPEDLSALGTLAQLQIAESDWSGVQQTYEKIWREAEVRAKAWAVLDHLVARLDDASEGAPDGFVAWYHEQKDLVENSVRWSTLPDD